ncbi:Uncharacterised protein [Mycobacterium tuberculosis]|nr:Uncharacterised protein [Mycobacterium tuberculosis]
MAGQPFHLNGNVYDAQLVGFGVTGGFGAAACRVVIAEHHQAVVGILEPTHHGSRRVGRVVFQERRHRSTRRMSADDNRADAELVDGEVECRVNRSVVRIGRHQVAEVADGVQVAGAAGGDDVRQNPRVGTGEEQLIRVL